MRKKPTVALMYDFDKTLCDQDMQDYAFIPNPNMTSEEFWGGNRSIPQKKLHGRYPWVYVLHDV